MDLHVVRNNINDIDSRMKLLFDERMNCSKQVADVKMETSDDIYKPLREKEICERFSGEVWYLPFMKKVMQISRRFQYQQFIEFDRTDKAFFDSLTEDQMNALEHGGIMFLNVRGDETSDAGLGIKDILSIFADTHLQIQELKVDGIENTVSVKFLVEDTDKGRLEALGIAYLMFKETI